MKKLALLIFLLVIPVFLTLKYFPINFNYLLTYSVCDQPIYYHLDTVDPKFNLSREEFLQDTNSAVQIWNNAQVKQLFVYNANKGLSVNLIYDERQSLTTEINQLENQVKSDKQSLNPKIAEYRSSASDFKQKVINLNKEIEYWNNQGGAPPEEYQKLMQKQQDLRTEGKRLNGLAQNLNISTGEYNVSVNELNQIISSFNAALEQRPEEGIFKGAENRIEIYFNINKDETIHTLAHEFGHALGILHASNPKAIMYYKTSQTTALTDEDINMLAEVCKKRSYVEFFQKYFDNRFRKLQQLIQD